MLARITFTFLLCGTLLMPSSADAVRPRSDVIEQLKADGRWEAYQAILANARRRGLDQGDARRLAAGAGAAAVEGDLRALVLLVDFSDQPAGAGVSTNATYFQDLLFSTNDPGRSLNDFYQENSYGKVTVDGDVVGWLRMPQTYAYYVNGQVGLGAYPQNSRRLAEDALRKADTVGVDFSLYDNDGNGQMDGFFVVHSGPGFEVTGDSNDIHSHKWQLVSPMILDGVTISNYTMQPEEKGDVPPTAIDIGVFCHEFGHFFGLPDLYDVDGTSQGLDKWVLMAAGNWVRDDGSSPAHFGAWSKIFLGWLTPINVTANLTGEVIPQVETDSVVYRLWTNGEVGNQYFLVENRQKVGFDLYLPGRGLLIYHVDNNVGGGNRPNDNEWYPGYTSFGHYKVALEQADGLFELEQTPADEGLAADAGDPWPGFDGRTSFDDDSWPDTRDYDFASTQVAVWGISSPGSTMTANLDVAWSRPRFVLLDHQFSGGGDSVPDPGEQVEFYATHSNSWLGVADAELSLATDDAQLSFIDSAVTLGAVASGDTVTSATPIVFTVPVGKVPRVVDFYVTITAAGGTYVTTDTLRVDVGSKQILLVDDDAGLGPLGSPDSAYLIPVLDEMRVPYAHWEVTSAGVPSALATYPMVFWYTGDERDTLFGGSDTIISPAEIAALEAYLDGGGSLFITGQQIVRYLDSMDTSFLHGYLKASYVGPAFDIFNYGVAGDIISDSTKFVLGGSGGAANQVAKDLVNPLDGALEILTETAPTNFTGIRYDGDYKVVLLGFGVEGIGDNVPPEHEAWPKSVLIERVSNWLLNRVVPADDSDRPTLPARFTLHPNYPNPFNPTTTISFTVGPGPARVELRIYNLLGQSVRRLAGGTFAPGRHEFLWDGRDEAGRLVSSGVYFYRLEGDQPALVRKMLLIK
jgi:immune inhibitor A